jgi:triphosphoribosyl-dephospho-CoA synthetase
MTIPSTSGDTSTPEPTEGVFRRAGRKRRWCLASIALALSAIGIDTASKMAANAGMLGMAHATVARTQGVPVATIESMKRQATTAAFGAGMLSLVGLCVAAASVACLSLSIDKRESRWACVPAGLLIVYVASLLVVV